MAWTYRIGEVAGTKIKVHVTFFLLPALYGVLEYQRAGPAAAFGIILLILALFLCVLLHEFGHILMARRFGVNTPDVILLPIGGVARLERMPDVPKQEFLIALAGPAVTLAIIIALYLFLALAGSPPSLRSMATGTPEFLPQLMALNVWLLAFNLIPAFPLDGGRVLRALLANRLGLVRGTRIAATVGQVFAVALGLYGLGGGPPLLALIAFFIFLGAGAETSAVETRVAGQGVSVAQMMVTRFRTIPVYATLQQAVELLLSGEQREFPVVDNTGRIEGILTRDNIIRGLSHHGPNAPVSEVMTATAPTITLSLGFEEALGRLRASGLPALPVVDNSGTLVGMLTMDNVTDLLLVRRARRET